MKNRGTGLASARWSVQRGLIYPGNYWSPRGERLLCFIALVFFVVLVQVELLQKIFKN